MEPVEGFNRAIYEAITGTYNTLIREYPDGDKTLHMKLNPRTLANLGMLPRPDCFGMVNMPLFSPPQWIYLRVLEHLPDLVESVFYEGLDNGNGKGKRYVSSIWNLIPDYQELNKELQALEQGADYEEEEEEDDDQEEYKLKRMVAAKKRRKVLKTGRQPPSKLPKVVRLRKNDKVAFVRPIQADRGEAALDHAMPQPP